MYFFLDTLAGEYNVPKIHLLQTDPARPQLLLPKPALSWNG